MAHVYVTKQPEGWETVSKLQQSTKNSLYADIFHNRGNRCWDAELLFLDRNYLLFSWNKKKKFKVYSNKITEIIFKCVSVCVSAESRVRGRKAMCTMMCICAFYPSVLFPVFNICSPSTSQVAR